MNDELITAAQNLGHMDGKAHGGWVKLTAETAWQIKHGYINSSKATLVLCPDPFAVEVNLANDPQLDTVERIAQLADISDFTFDTPEDISEALKEAKDMLQEYEIAFREGFWRTVLDAADTILGIGA